MKRMLVLADSPTCATGFAQVSRNILKTLRESGKYEIVVVGINYDGIGYDHNKYPYLIIPATSALNPRYNDLYGRQRVLDELATGSYDILFMIQDLPVVQQFAKQLSDSKKKHGFKIVHYIPVDSYLDTNPEWITEVLPFIDYPVAYTQFARKELMKFAHRGDIDVCLHGVDSKLFKPLSDLDKAKVLNDFFAPLERFTPETVEKRFKVINVNRNQIRKDYLRTFQIIKRYKDKYPEDNIFYMVVAQTRDQGGDLIPMAKQWGLDYGVDWAAVVGYTASNGHPVEAVPLWYNSADAVLSATVGEGFGLSSIEGMACGIPCVFPDNTALTEVFGEGARGFLVPSGSCDDEWMTYGAYDSSLIRPRMNIDSAVEALRKIRVGGEAIDKMVKMAYGWARDHDWENVNKFWLEIFEKACRQKPPLKLLQESDEGEK